MSQDHPMNYRENAKEPEPIWHAEGPWIVSQNRRYRFRAMFINYITFDDNKVFIHFGEKERWFSEEQFFGFEEAFLEALEFEYRLRPNHEI